MTTPQKYFLYFRTLKYLRLRQIMYRFWYILKKQFGGFDYNLLEETQYRDTSKYQNLTISFPPNTETYFASLSFSFLNLSYTFSDNIEWNFSGYKKLWTYNLNYFDFLLQKSMSKDTGQALINQYIDDFDNIKYGKEPYPTSLRIINWVKFCISNKISSQRIITAVNNQTIHLSKNLEYHLLANHLLENAFALCCGSAFCQNSQLLIKGIKLLNNELNEQILPDGAHYERSPMYHQIILFTLLDTIQVLELLTDCGVQHCIKYRITASKMLGWIKKISFSGVHIPLFKDSANKIAPTTQGLIDYAFHINSKPKPVVLKESGYRKFQGANWEMIIDVGEIAPSYQPGHAHADTFSFELYIDANPVIIDTGTSTYNSGERRILERGTTSHNTVTIDNQNSTEVWSSHRVGERAHVNIRKDGPTFLEAFHDGYKKMNYLHHRNVNFTANEIEINDWFSTVNNESNSIRIQADKIATARLHFHPGVTLQLLSNRLILDNKKSISFNDATNIRLVDYFYASEFNHLIPGICCEIDFIEKLTTKIHTL